MSNKEELKLGIDLGTVNTLVYANSRGIIFNEPTVIAFDKETDEVVAVGNEANDMVGKTHAKVRVVKPLVSGVIADKNAAIRLIEYILNDFLEHYQSAKLKKSTVLICCHSDLSGVERNALKDIVQGFGINNVLVQEEVKAGAIGVGIDIYSPTGSMIIDIGGGSTDVGVLALGDIVVSNSVKTAGNHLDAEIKKYIKMKRNFEIGMSTAERVKIALATVREDLVEEKEMVVSGRNLTNGLPSRITVKQSEIRDVLRKPFQTIINAILKVLEQTPPEIATDIIENGVILNGGGSQIDGLKEFIESIINIEVKLSPYPLTAIVKGTKELLKNNGDYLVAPTD
ncbi:rod shape-determining protein [Haloplasma contractile]|uniref:Cell shape-determining protein MreB n=1 Tax=Haloplasma contractile SSD-17B TaxID=1033810 RepID=U2FCY4_9MOLU|nr:rod shape-determining protein [Haloplasma contractile]ERJ10880.1 dihydrolipoamide dehydrogenase protein [Haloplasma contractile SSD-17B]